MYMEREREKEETVRETVRGTKSPHSLTFSPFHLVMCLFFPPLFPVSFVNTIPSFKLMLSLLERESEINYSQKDVNLSSYFSSICGT